jgi:sortase A
MATSTTTASPPGLAPAPPPALGPVRRGVREIGLAMITGGFVVLLFVAYQLFGTTLTEQHDQSRLAHQFASALHDGGQVTAGAPAPGTGGGGDSPTVSGGTVDLSPSTPTGSAVDHLVIPRIGVDKFVVQGTAQADLMEGPGHYVGTPFPGQRGNAAIAGHRTTYGAPFFRLNELRTGDRIYVTNTRGRTFVYHVVRQEIVPASGPEATAVLANTATTELTLTTCNPRFEAINRLVVVADLSGRPAPTPTPTPPPTPTPVVASTPRVAVGAPNLGRGDGGAWPPALGYGAGFVLLWIATRLAVNRTRRWRRAGALVVGILICAVPLWFCFENVVRLLPQSI